VPIQLTQGFAESLPDLRRQIEEAKRTIAEATQSLRDLQELVAIIERAQGSTKGKGKGKGKESAPSILVAADQFKGVKAADAVKRILVTNPERSYRVSQLADALYRGGQSSSLPQIRQNVAAFVKYARERQYLIPGGNGQGYKLSAAGRQAYSSAAVQPVSLFPSSAEG
jgi:hypothetical protein